MIQQVGIVTVTYNSGEVLPDFLESLERQSHSQWTLLAIDNASQDDSVERLRKWKSPRLELIANKDNVGVAEGNNQGISRSIELGFDWVLLLNNDTVFPAKLIADLIQSAERSKSDVLVPRITYHERPDLNWYAGGHFSWWRGIQSRHQGELQPDIGANTLRHVDYSPTCCMLVRRRVFESVGLMDPAYFVYWDDSDFCWRLKRAGIKITYDPSIVMLHKVSALTGGQQSDFSVYYYSRNQIYFLRKHFPLSVVAFNLTAIRAKNWLRRHLGLDDSVAATLREKAIRAGLLMPVKHRVS